MRNYILILMITVSLIGMIPLVPTYSVSLGQHNFIYENCITCHKDIQYILNQSENPYPKHNEIGCEGCHTQNSNESHAAKIVYCTNCHNVIHHNTINITNCRDCHTSHGGQIPEVKGSKNYQCMTCHKT